MILFHGACNGCTRQDTEGLSVCTKCLYFELDHRFPDLSGYLDESYSFSRYVPYTDPPHIVEARRRARREARRLRWARFWRVFKLFWLQAKEPFLKRRQHRAVRKLDRLFQELKRVVER